MNPLAQSQFKAPHGLPVYFRTTGQLHLSDATISLDEMVFRQKRSAESNLKELIWLCRERYWYALKLIHPRSYPPDSLFDREALDLGEFYLPWAELCALYRRLVFEPQIDLFEAQRERELRKWHRFLEKECFERVTKCPEWTRCVLETAGLLETHSPGREVHIVEMFDAITENVEDRYGREIEPRKE
ncbi:hypothetical protein [Altererythrobacter sp. GH1-8]|uniref:hypothetical protein n=1 Tax=Altererythrobacter sp. GH1-8 TaxID=3349333 RepID=UPI00374D28C8